MTRGQKAIRDFVRATRDTTGNLPPLPGIFSDYPAPVALTASGSPACFAGGCRDCPIWRRADHQYTQYQQPALAALVKPPSRCLVPATSFCEYEDTKPRKSPTWFALGAERPLVFFAGIRTPWFGATVHRGGADRGEHKLSCYLTTEADAVVGAIHPRPMPAIEDC